MKITKNNMRGITLIALVVTIVVLLILAGITIGALTGDNSTINEALKAKELSERAELEELIDLAIIKAEEKYPNPTINQVIAEIKNKNVISSDEQVDKETGKITTDKGYEFEGKLDDYIGKVSTGDNDGNTTGGGTTDGDDTKRPSTIEELKEGSYVNYIDKSNTTRKSVVLYDATSTYGIQIITKDTVEDNIVLGNSSSINTSITSYNGAISTLNTKANNYLNTTYASKARCVGSVPNNPSSEASRNHISSYNYMYNYTNRFKDEDENYVTDYSQMEKLGINNVEGKTYWLASRSVSSGANFTSFDIYAGAANNRVITWNCGIINASSTGGLGNVSANSNPSSLRPVFTLNAGIKITGGEGTESTPYTLGV